MQSSMRWDIFCKVIDNHGDLGVCWRLACQLAGLGELVRLWVDDATALHWMAPSGGDGVEVIDWLDPAALRAAVAQPAPDVLIEAFGCEPAPELIARFAEGPGLAWVNLEYLSAEPYVERLHGLPSPVFKGPGAGLTKRFFYPGFTPATGGLLREPGLMERRARFERAPWLAALQIPWRSEERLVSLFCYEPPALADLLARLAEGGQPTRLLVTAGRATQAVQALLGSAPSPQGHGALSISYLPYLTQPDFDHLLWACDLNFVRGEDSLVRALWAGAPLVWQIYPQDDDAHHVKLNAWLDWIGAPPSLRLFHHAWNGFGNGALPVPEIQGQWQETALNARARLLAQDDLVTQLRNFVAQKS
ncbi:MULTISPECIES: elongation factor P maturation arginine rhamnosyltransferase EarP [unclassified Variovorax]|uniref:elongation factor P maturation arginine rhamnosyltransferase EarP n=1 Tax=unclassified Variovorax TaxID=663243 RepID=UPI000F7F3041|nr:MULTISPECIES: elongation factor P maturation arginine rhamnosyltransferase EarP [unclassified Variovorax]RSZ34373.1 elongation factor P maturation arginine rhamnosyltransferase EarP [Variovorax sp. 553]RSZ34870.1 elongation factor P maturation arginine rhamnosyltransferase EarP [Variovorax sp. 679]